MVTTPEPTSITDSYSLLKALNRHPRFSSEASRIKVIANKVNSQEEGEILFGKLNAVVSGYLKLPIVYLDAVPDDAQLSQAVMQQMPVSLQSPQAKSALAFEKIAEKLMNIEKDQKIQKRGMEVWYAFKICETWK